jgi:hypothetical protein
MGQVPRPVAFLHQPLVQGQQEKQHVADECLPASENLPDAGTVFDPEGLSKNCVASGAASPKGTATSDSEMMICCGWWHHPLDTWQSHNCRTAPEYRCCRRLRPRPPASGPAQGTGTAPSPLRARAHWITSSISVTVRPEGTGIAVARQGLPPGRRQAPQARQHGHRRAKGAMHHPTAGCCRASSRVRCFLPRSAGKGPRHPAAGGMGHDHLVDEALFSRHEGVGKAVLIILHPRRDLFGSPNSLRYRISTAPLAPITATSAVGQA